MKRSTPVAVLALVSVIGSGCASMHRSNLPWRTADAETKRAHGDICPPTTPPLPNRIRVDQLANQPVQKAIQCTSTEKFTDGDADTEFDLHVVEFDDQGLFWNRNEVKGTLEDIEKVRKDNDVLLVVFVHGWFNNAEVCNGKLACFRELLSLLAEAERPEYRSKLGESMPGASGKPRRVIGVYAGWRGETVRIPALKYLTFFGRKGAAHTVGENGAATELIGSLARIAHPGSTGSSAENPGTPKPPPARDLSSLIAIGHSFGGALLMSAIGNELSRAAGEAMTQNRTSVTVVSRMADLTVLINPAVEASRFDNVRRAASEATFSQEQTPILLTLSSVGDVPNKVLFPIGQTLAFFPKAARSREQWQSMIQSLGTFKANHTHQLIASGPAPPKTGRTAPCLCEAGISEYRDVLLAQLLRGAQAEKAAEPSGTAADFAHGRRRDFRYSRLEQMQDTDPNSPFMMVQVDGDVIDGHSGLFNARSVDFLLEFIVRSEAKRRLVRTRSDVPVTSRPMPPAPAAAAANLPKCFRVTRSPDGPVSIVTLANTLSRQPRYVRIERLANDRASLLLERKLDSEEREFPFHFTVPGATYKLSAADAVSCAPKLHTVPEPHERTPPFAYSLFAGVADGLGLQGGASLSMRRISVESSIIKSAAAHHASFTADYALGLRSKRSLSGIGVRQRHGVADEVNSRIAYVHYTLEMPGVKLFGETWSSWMGLEVKPYGWSRLTRKWEPQFELGLRLQVRLPREHWIGGS